MKTTVRAHGGGDGYNDSSSHTTSPFALKTLTRVAYGSKRATGQVDVVGVGTLSIDCFEPADKPPFVVPTSVRSKYTGAYERVAWLDVEFADAVLRVVKAALDEGGQ